MFTSVDMLYTYINGKSIVLEPSLDLGSTLEAWTGTSEKKDKAMKST